MKAILLIPAPGDPHSLLAPGECGAMAPSAFRCACKRWRVGGDGPCTCGYGASLDRALVLAYAGEPVVEGCDRAARLSMCTPSHHYAWHDAADLAEMAAATLGGEVVVL